MYRASFVRTALRLFLAAFLICQAQTALAQTVSDPGVAEFDPSSDHSTVASDGTPRVREYLLSLYVAGQSSPFTTVSLGKPSPESDGKIRVHFLPLISPLTSGVLYEARVAATGPGGTSTSLASNQFQYSAACTTGLSANTQFAGSGGGTGSVNVTSPAGCTWSASSQASWLTITTGTSYSGSASVGFSIAANATQSARTGTMTIAGGTFTVTQAALSCSTALSANTQSAGSGRGSGSVNVRTAAGCTWSASSQASWLTITSGASYSGPASVGFSIAANTTQSTRTGTMTIAGGTFTVTQAGLSCSYALSANGQALTSAGGTGSVTMVATNGCAWTASSSASWLTVTSGASATGPGTVAFRASANTSTTARTATLTIAGQTYTVHQSGVSCSYTMSPNNRALTPAGGIGSVSVTAPTGCAWAARSSATWLSITSGESGSGNGTVAYRAAVNTASSARTATVSVGGQTVTVTQSGTGSCRTTLNSTSRSLSSKSSTGTITVTTGTGCSWTATSSVRWITVTGVSTINKTVSYAVSANDTGALRTGTMVIGGVTFTVTQRADSAPNPPSGLRVISSGN
jgi:hypothetical protein